MKKINTKVSKRIAAIILAAFAACSVMGCSVEKNFTVTETYTTSADGENTVVEAEEIDADEPELFSQVPMAIANDMGFDITELNIKMSTDETWSDNLVDEGVCIENGVVARGITMTFDEEHRFIDIHVAGSNGEDIEFNGLELPTEFDDEIVLSFECEGEGSYTVYTIS